MCVLSQPEKHTAAASFCLLFGGDRRGRGSERLTAGLLRFKSCLTGHYSLLVLSLACFFFLPNLSFPLIPLQCASGFFAWNTEIACVLFYLSGIQ
ncbi:hypothetical protein EXN66_Car015780 [Channa argus]|uniref:Uncharacterized protein n=1 Tax=Channa argus TaxID=215402 RepID=A0A6G1QCN8_CHAAH|nr:hypothetical protein EXN66_Car015780 [Channa argus]